MHNLFSVYLVGEKSTYGSCETNGIMELRTVKVTRYIAPLKEGGSLPAIAEADDEFLYVLKFKGAGQGHKALIAELIGGEIARAAQLRVPEIVFAELDNAFGRTEPDPEIQDLLKASAGLNLGLHFLKGAATYDPVLMQVDVLLASKIVWLDAFIRNVDRTVRNTNMLIWNKELWLIDHGASLYFHHSWKDYMEQSTLPFMQAKDHVLIPFADKLEEADRWFHRYINEQIIHQIVDAVPDEWLVTDTPFASAKDNRDAYTGFLTKRLEYSETFLKHLIDVRETVI